MPQPKKIIRTLHVNGNYFVVVLDPNAQNLPKELQEVTYPISRKIFKTLVETNAQHYWVPDENEEMETKIPGHDASEKTVSIRIINTLEELNKYRPFCDFMNLAISENTYLRCLVNMQLFFDSNNHCLAGIVIYVEGSNSGPYFFNFYTNGDSEVHNAFSNGQLFNSQNNTFLDKNNPLIHH